MLKWNLYKLLMTEFLCLFPTASLVFSLLLPEFVLIANVHFFLAYITILAIDI